MNVFEHFREEEREFIQRILKLKEYVEDTYSPKLLQFLTPREQFIVTSLLGNQDVKVEFYGGKTSMERKRAFLFPSYFQPSTEDFQISLIEIQYPSKFSSLTHPKILGTLLGTGIKRENIGDILIQDEIIQFYCNEELADYIRLQVDRIGPTSVQLVHKPESEALCVEDMWYEKSGTVSSLRLDAILSEIFHVSRQKAQLLIKSGKAAVNWTPQEKSDFQCQMGDVFSLRGFGRGKLIHIDGKTKKDKWKITFGLKK